MQWLLQNIQTIFLGVFIAISAIGWVVRQLVEQRSIKQARDAEERRREEVRRTGRDASGRFVDVERMATATQSAGTSPTSGNDTPPSVEEVKRRLQELAQRRRAELAEMVRRQQAGQAGGSPMAAPIPLPPPAVLGPSGPSARGQPTAQRPPARPALADEASARRSAPTSGPRSPRPPARTAPQPPQRPAAQPSFGVPVQRPPAQRSAESQQRTQRPGVSADADEQLRQRRQRDRAAKAKTDAARQRSLNEPDADRQEQAAHEFAKNAMRSDSGDPRSTAVMSAGSAPARLAQILGLQRIAVGVEGGTDIPPSEWRKALVMMEVLNKPACMRDNDERVF